MAELAMMFQPFLDISVGWLWFVSDLAGLPIADCGLRI
jgi:hypothetical protein